LCPCLKLLAGISCMHSSSCVLILLPVQCRLSCRTAPRA
jgi:hypothetical protein